MSARESLDRAIAHIAARQHGVFTTRQALTSGLSRRAIEHRVMSGRWERAAHGVLRISGAPRTWHQAVLTACLATRGAASHRTAAVLLGLEGISAGQIEVVVARSRRPRRPGIRVHRSRYLPRSDVTTVDEIPVTTPARTLLDLASVVAAPALEVALDDALRRRLVSIEDLRRRLNRSAYSRVRALRTALDQRSDGEVVPGSILETAFLRLLKGAGLPHPRRQYAVKRGARTIAIVDFAYPELLLAIEIDGYRYHSGRRRWQHDLARQNELAASGWIILRFSAVDVTERPDETVTRVAIAAAQCAGDDLRTSGVEKRPGKARP